MTLRDSRHGRRFVLDFMVAGSLALLSGCAGNPSGFERIHDPELPIERRGFVVYPPSQGDWSLNETTAKDTTRLIIARDVDAAPQGGKIGATTHIIVSFAEPSEEVFSQYFTDQHDALEKLSKELSQPATGRFKDLSCETSWGTIHGQEFSRVVRRVEERENPIDPSAVLVMEQRTTWVFHPTKPRASMRVEFSHRRPAGQPMEPISELEDAFLAKLEFSGTSARN
jgi:hypothetical protein